MCPASGTWRLCSFPWLWRPRGGCRGGPCCRISSSRYRGRARERETRRETRDRDRDTRERQTDRQAGSQTARQIARQVGKHTQAHASRGESASSPNLTSKPQNAPLSLSLVHCRYLCVCPTGAILCGGKRVPSLAYGMSRQSMKYKYLRTAVLPEDERKK